MSKTICRICLRTDLKTGHIDEALVDFHDEITDFSIEESNVLKYCSICEHLLWKFYNFSQKCSKANRILKSFKKGKNGGFPSNLHEMLPPSSLICTIPSTFQLYINNDILEPLTGELVIKQEKDEIGNDLENNANSEVTDILQTNNDVHDCNSSDESGNSCFVRTLNVSEILNRDQEDTNKITLLELADIYSGDEDMLEKNENHLSLKEVESTLKKPQICEEQNTLNIEVKQEDYSSDLQDDYNEDLFKQASDTEMINELEMRIQATSKARKKKGSSIPKPRRKPPLKNLKELEKVFDIQVFATDQEAKDELQQRKTSERYLSAEHKCTICYMVCKYPKSVEFHMQWHGPSAGDYECSICSMRFKSKAAAKSHKASSHYGKFKCKMCPKVTYHKTAVAKHYQNHVNVSLTCEHCGHTFTHTTSYKSHMRLKHTTDHVCVTCALNFLSEKGLIAHRFKKHKTMSKVDEGATAHCAPCALTFADEQVYTVHVMNAERHKDIAKSIIACKVCGVRFEDKGLLRDHKRSQHSIPTKKRKSVMRLIKKVKKDNFTCSICGVAGRSDKWLLKHIRSSHPDSPYVADLKKRRHHMCETCGKCYTTIYMLRDHIAMHTGVKSHACTKCPARFFTRHQLLMHGERHAPARRVCAQCGKKFVSAANLYYHMRTHIQDRRFKCSLCGKGFLHAASLREHVSGVHHNVRRARKLVKGEAVTEEETCREPATKM